MLDLVLKLIDKLTELVKRREAVDKDLFSNFLVPAMADFEAVHKSYVESFHKYRECVADRNNVPDEGHPVFALIDEDMRDSIDLRGKVYALYQLGDDPVFSRFISSIQEYLDYKFYFYVSPEDLYSNFARMSARDDLYMCLLGRGRPANADEDARRAAALALINSHIKTLKIKYSSVVNEFTKLKIRLLMPK